MHSNKASSKTSKKTTFRSNHKTKSSGGVRDENTVDSQVLKTNLHEFYKNSKEKLLKLKQEFQEVEAEVEQQKVENNQLSVKQNELSDYNEELQLRLKGMKQKLIYAQKNKTALQTQINEMTNSFQTTNREIETMKIDTEFKSRIIQNDIAHSNLVRENNVKSIHKKIQDEEEYKLNMTEKIFEITAEIDRYKGLISEINQQDSIRTKNLLKETTEMTKFLSEL